MICQADSCRMMVIGWKRNRLSRLPPAKFVPSSHGSKIGLCSMTPGRVISHRGSPVALVDPGGKPQAEAAA
eukprot:609597-Hanusia_phi.AAC.1